MKPDFDRIATLAMEGWQAGGQVALDPFLAGLFVQIVRAELEKVWREARNGGGMSEEERASAFRAGLERAAEIVDHASQMPFGNIPGVDVVRATASALRAHADRLR